MISFHQVCKSFGRDDDFAVREVSLTIPTGETLVLLGSSGSGKTTLLRLINRLIEPTAGTVKIDGIDVAGQDAAKLRRGIGYVFQGIGLFPHLTVASNVALVPRLLHWGQARRRRRAEELLEMVGLPPADYAMRYPDELSGGQQQRVGVARALAGEPEILLMDEPFGALDAITRDGLQQEMLALKQRLHKTIVFVTHDLNEALLLGDRIAVMHRGNLEQIGTGEELQQNPQTEFVRDLFGMTSSPATGS